MGSGITQSSNSTASTITYQYTLSPGQTLGASTNRTFAAQMSGTGTAPYPAGDVNADGRSDIGVAD